MTELFDQFSKDYNFLADKAIGVTGYDTMAIVDLKLKKLQKLYPNLIGKRFHFLDYGCGIGNLYGSIEKFFPKVVYSGVDESTESICEAQSRFSCNSNFQNLNSLQWRNKKYDLIFSSGVFHHIPHQEHGSIIQYLSNLLNPNGKIVIWEHNPINPVTQKIFKECVFDKDAVMIQSKELKRHLTEASFIKVQIIYTMFFPKVLSSFNILDSYLILLFISLLKIQIM